MLKAKEMSKEGLKAYRTYTPTAKKAQTRQRFTEQEGFQKLQQELNQSNKLTSI